MDDGILLMDVEINEDAKNTLRFWPSRCMLTAGDARRCALMACSSAERTRQSS